MYQLIVYYHGPEERKEWFGTRLKHIWHLNPQLYDDRSSVPIWNGGVISVKVDPTEDSEPNLQSLLMREARKLISNGITVDRRGNFVVEPDRIQISLERHVED